MNSRIVTAVGVSVLSAGIMANSGGGAPVGAAVQTANVPAACSRLVGARLGSPHTEITAAEQITSPFAAPDNARSRGVSVDTPFCRVSGVARPTADSEIRFEVWLPPAEAWNGRFRGVGAGGSTGAISYGPMSTSVTDGYAVVATDNGHTSTSGFDGSWSLGHPQRVVDFGHRAQHEATVAGKAVTARYYGRAADYAYFVGCSQGGHHALMEAQRYPDDYDGIVAGAPANYWTGLMAGELWSGLASLHDPAGSLPDAKLPMLGAAVLAACDDVDGLADGLIDDPRKCDVDVAALECANGDDTDCLTAAEVEAVEKIYEGPRNPRTGERIYPGYPPGSEYFASPGGIGGWGPFWAGIAEPGGSSNDFMKYTVFRDPDYDVRTFDFDRDWALVNERQVADDTLASALNATDADLSPLDARGGKLLIYHGWADPLVTPYNTVDYYEEVVRSVGGRAEAEDFVRLFMAPGVGHCRGGAGPDRFDMPAALERWVEQGVAPDRITASHMTDGEVDRTRPLCPYPQVARWTGQGSIDEAANFRCVLPD